MAGPRRFTVGGPFEVATRGAPRSKSLDRSAYRDLWANAAEKWRDERGCYVFALRRGRGYLPIYVGKTTRQSFEKECFVDRNYRLLHEALSGESGTLVLFLLKYEATRGRFNEDVVGDLEKYLVETALERNRNLKNRVYTNQRPGFAIRGLHREPGRPSKPATELKKALGL